MLVWGEMVHSPCWLQVYCPDRPVSHCRQTVLLVTFLWFEAMSPHEWHWGVLLS